MSIENNNNKRFAISIKSHLGEIGGKHMDRVTVIASDQEARDQHVKQLEDRMDVMLVPEEQMLPNPTKNRSAFGFTGNWKGSNWEPAGPQIKMGGYTAPEDKNIN